MHPEKNWPLLILYEIGNLVESQKGYIKKQWKLTINAELGNTLRVSYQISPATHLLLGYNKLEMGGMESRYTDEIK